MSSEEIADMLNWHDVHVETYMGETSEGSVWAPSTTVEATVNETVKTVMGADGQDTTSTASISCMPNLLSTFSPQSRVTLPSGRTAIVISAALSVQGRGPISGIDNAVVYVQ